MGKRKIIVSFCIMLIAVLLLVAIETKADSLSDIDNLISQGLYMTDTESAEAYLWVSDVQKFIENYKESLVYKSLDKYCKSAQSYRDISLFNTKNQIVGALMYLKDEISCAPLKDPLQLINESYTFSDEEANAYKWVFEVLAVNSNNEDSSVYNSLKKDCNSAKDYRDISLFNTKSKIIAGLTILDNEIVVSSVLTDLVISESPDKTTYEEGESFDPDGVVLEALLTNTYKNGTVKEVSIVVEDYSIDINRKLKESDQRVVFSYNYNGVTKTATLPIEVERIVPEIDEVRLVSISVVSQPQKTEYLIGEAFDSKGLRVDAKYKNTWSDGSVTYSTIKNVDFTVDEKTPLTKKDKKWSVYYNDDGIETKESIKIKVKSSDPIINYSKVSLRPGDTCTLRVYGTDKFVMWKCERNDSITLNDNGVVQAWTAGKVKVTATVGSGKKNTKLECVVTVKPAVSVDKKILFVELDEYETIRVNDSKLSKKYSWQLRTQNNLFHWVEGNDNTLNIIPDYAGISRLEIVSNKNGYQYTECSIPVIIYPDGDEKDRITISYYALQMSNGEKTAVQVYLSNHQVTISGKDLVKELEKNCKKTEKNYDYYTISKKSFEKLIKKALKNNALSFDY